MFEVGKEYVRGNTKVRCEGYFFIPVEEDSMYTQFVTDSEGVSIGFVAKDNYVKASVVFPAVKEIKTYRVAFQRRCDDTWHISESEYESIAEFHDTTGYEYQKAILLKDEA